ncbi:GNAT family N-acetyltransferase [Mucilaginibacter glaciei]|uniref:GNAT family N-acetyltransferase n=1 Tax=Mucilaginibacter glaciei TaxID=2772109 RepID=A0A926S403_9SPHI|nr:GNAT family N-acetyltransferase [Mucilaginibacter glaciei]MBD1395472.1 GNAT family N-acetyltransferase [Mucilaginibacter glaciei]
MDDGRIIVRLAQPSDHIYAQQIADETERSAIARGSGISKRSAGSVNEKIAAGKAIMAVSATGDWVGFSYFDVWDNGKFVSNSGLIVSPGYRQNGVAAEIKEQVFNLCRQKHPESLVFSITSGAAIMKLNTRLGFEPVTYDQITHDETFWAGCKSCVNYDVLTGKNKCNCLCTAMLFNPANN